MPPAVPHSHEHKDQITNMKLAQILAPDRPLCKEDVIWILELIKKKVAEEDPRIAELPQPRLLQNFRCFAEIALMLIQRRHGFDSEADRLKNWLYEATYGLHPELPGKSGSSRQTS